MMLAVTLPTDRQWYGQDGRVAAVDSPLREAETHQLGATTMRFLVTHDMTEGRFGLFRWEMGPDSGGASPHFHRTIAETFIVLDGAVGLYDGQRWVTRGPGDVVYVPEGGIHGFRQEGEDPSTMLILFVPGPRREEYFLELVDVVTNDRTLSEGEWRELWARHDQYPAT